MQNYNQVNKVEPGMLETLGRHILFEPGARVFLIRNIDYENKIVYLYGEGVCVGHYAVNPDLKLLFNCFVEQVGDYNSNFDGLTKEDVFKMFESQWNKQSCQLLNPRICCMKFETDSGDEVWGLQSFWLVPDTGKSFISAVENDGYSVFHVKPEPTNFEILEQLK